ncbi:nuclear transport factor 2 family protein [uncultured Flavobacterium sp.]|uniref:nuclear transport factor 2 family protein n=1 Tax=uncultured Flavobacterium sp. TaxID=165435 RepID=UPI0030EF4392
MKKIFFQIALLFIISSCVSNKNLTEETSKSKINSIVDKWHKDAAETNFQAYFDAIADDGIFIGTDATENWNKKDFMTFSKPFFDKGKAWDFTSLERNIYFSTDGKTAWFDELLNTQMKICRGSGVLVRINNDWKIKHYVLSMTIPNDNSTEVISIKSTIEDKIIKEKKK